MRWWLGLAVGAVLAACGGGEALPPATTVGAAPAPVATTATTQAAPTTTGPETVPLGTYAFVMTVAIEPEQGPATVASQLEGAAQVAPHTARISGELFGSGVDLLTDGSQWWDLAEPDLPLTADDVTFFLAGNGFLRPEDIQVLLANPDPWNDLGPATHLDVPVSHRQRTGIVKDRDWAFGDLASLEVWSDGEGNVVKLVARWATGDNLGFPVSTWEITSRNPAVALPAPPSY